MPFYKALVSFSGEVAGAPGQVVELNDKAIAKDYIRAGYIEELSKDEAAAEQARRDAETERIDTANKAQQEANDEVVLPRRDKNEDAASTQDRLNKELRGNRKSLSAKEELGTADEATAAYQGAEYNAQDAAANPKPTVNAVKSGQTSQGGVNVDPPKDGNSTLGTSQATDDPGATIPETKQAVNQAAVEAQDAVDKLNKVDSDKNPKEAEEAAKAAVAAEEAKGDAIAKDREATEAKKDELPANEPGVQTTVKPRTVNRSAVTGKVVSAEEAKANPDTTVTETVKK